MKLQDSIRDLDRFVHTVRRNCDISDARYAGVFSVCGLALRLRDLYKWEAGLPPWEERDPKTVLDWIGEKEALWESMTDLPYAALTLDGRSFDPFEAREVNRLLESRGMFYGAGYGYSLKPTFFLAPLVSRKKIEGHPVISLGKELARDLTPLPALVQDECIVMREDTARTVLWERLFYLKKSKKKALNRVLEDAGTMGHSLRSALPALYRIQRNNFIYHEIGELEEIVFDRELWREIIAAFPHTPIELLARALKDLLADTGPDGTLTRLLKERFSPGLGLYSVLIDGLLPSLVPELDTGLHEFLQSGNWQRLTEAVGSGYRKVTRYAEQMMDFYRQGKDRGDMGWVEEKIRKNLLEPILDKSSV